ncbi:hypothetical protein [Marinagarivorans algicola]|uniref:hypothetical protein n=1 Tax=Marinagarivorans algicola TaxID=1513270 RepID=UPI003736CA82
MASIPFIYHKIITQETLTIESHRLTHELPEHDDHLKSLKVKHLQAKDTLCSIIQKSETA